MQFEKMCKRLLIREPFYGLIMLGIDKIHTTKVPTAAVAKSGLGVALLINDTFWESLNETQQEAILLHEVHHLCFNHLVMSADFENSDLFNKAADLEVNCYITGLPQGALSCADFGFEEKKGAKYYYEQLKKLQSKQPSNGQGGGGGGNGQNNPQSGGAMSKGTIDDHSPWKEFKSLSNAEKELVQQQVDGIVKAAAEQTVKQRGTIPAHLKSRIDKLLKVKPRIYDWKAQFRMQLGTELDLKYRKTHKRESRRFTDTPGIRFKKKVNILVGIDTSESVSDKELADFFSEIHHIYKAGARVHVVEYDAAIHGEWDFKGLKNINITGRGGTDFEPIFEYYRVHRKDYTMLVNFTDGFAPVASLPHLSNVLWVITSSGSKDNQYPGKVIFIPEDTQEDA